MRKILKISCVAALAFLFGCGDRTSVEKSLQENKVPPLVGFKIDSSSGFKDFDKFYSDNNFDNFVLGSAKADSKFDLLGIKIGDLFHDIVKSRKLLFVKGDSEYPLSGCNVRYVTPYAKLAKYDHNLNSVISASSLGWSEDYNIGNNRFLDFSKTPENESLALCFGEKFFGEEVQVDLRFIDGRLAFVSINKIPGGLIITPSEGESSPVVSAIEKKFKVNSSLEKLQKKYDVESCKTLKSSSGSSAESASKIIDLCDKSYHFVAAMRDPEKSIMVIEGFRGFSVSNHEKIGITKSIRLMNENWLSIASRWDDNNERMNQKNEIKKLNEISKEI